MKTRNIAMLLTLAFATFAHAGVSPEEAKQLGTTLTPWGAIKAGNKEGTVPPYEGGLPVTTAPAGFVKDSGHWADPYANEKPLYSITAKNMDQYADKLSEVTKEMLKRFPTTYRLDVYPTHRSVSYPPFFVDNSIKNAANCKSIEDGLALEGCFGGIPFPIPKTGNEAMWNIQLAYRKPFKAEYEVAYVDGAGSVVPAAIQDASSDLPYYDARRTLPSFQSASPPPYYRAKALQVYPPRIAGDGTLVMYFTNPIKNPNKGWNYQQGNRRVRSIPDAQYDYPILISGGAQFFDEAGFSLGKQDRFDYKLLGTREMIIPYNNYRYLESTKEALASVGGGKHPNPDLLRWELHRVRVVEGTLKTGSRHAYAKRRYYIDEDYPGSGVADAWDHGGKPYRGYFATSPWAYDKQAPLQQNASIEYDLSSGVWYTLPFYQSTIKKLRGVHIFNENFPESEFTPEALSRATAR